MGYNLEDIKNRLGKKQQISAAELAALLTYDHANMFDLMVINNPSNVNNTLRHIIGMRDLPYAPDTKKLLNVINGMCIKQDTQHLQKVSDNFKFNYNAKNYTTTPALVDELRKQFPNWFK